MGLLQKGRWVDNGIKVMMVSFIGKKVVSEIG